jgi:REP element-mobilizing transposase RayT
MRLSAAGRIVTAEWKRLAHQFANIHLNAFMVMPNHVHGIIAINDPVGATRYLPIDALTSTKPVTKDAPPGPDGSPVHGDARVGATRHLPIETLPGIEPVSKDAPPGPDGSPVHGRDEAVDFNFDCADSVGATHHLPIDALSSTKPVSKDAPPGPDGSPVHGRDEAVDFNLDCADSVGATRHLSIETLPGIEPVSKDAPPGPVGSPVHCRDEAVDFNLDCADSVGATHHLPIDALSSTKPVSKDTLPGSHGSHVQTRGCSPVPKGPAKGSLGAMIGQFKSRATKRIWSLPEYDHQPIWQRNYYEHIIRDDAEWERIYEYIQNNPLRWEEDQLHPNAPDNPFKQE